MAERSLPVGTQVVAGAFLVSGSVHLLRPAVYEPLVPPHLGAAGPWVIGSGVAELVCAVGLLRRASWAPVASAALLVAVWPGNVWFAIATQRRSRAPIWLKAVAWLRLPVQVPLIRWALRSPTASH